MTDGEQILARIQQRLEKLGLTENAAGVAAGSREIVRSIRRGIARGIQHNVRAETLTRLAPVLRTSEQWLLTGEGPEDVDLPLPANARGDVRAAEVEMPPRTSFPLNMPVYGTALGSMVDRVEGTLIERDVVDMVRRPPTLARNRSAYAIYVAGESMMPLHNPGDLRFVDPLQRPAIGDSVVVVTRHHEHDPGQAYIKILRKRTSDFLTVEQLNPHATLKIPVAFISEVHRVLTMNDLFGV